MKENFSVPFSPSGVPEVQKFVSRKKEIITIKEAFGGDGSQRKVVLLQGLYSFFYECFSRSLQLMSDGYVAIFPFAQHFFCASDLPYDYCTLFSNFSLYRDLHRAITYFPPPFPIRVLELPRPRDSAA